MHLPWSIECGLESYEDGVYSGRRTFSDTEDLTPTHGLDHRCNPRYETDGGVRLAGGRPREAVVDELDGVILREVPTLPPPYSSTFIPGENLWCVPYLSPVLSINQWLNIPRKQELCLSCLQDGENATPSSGDSVCRTSS